MSILSVNIFGFPPILDTWNCYSFSLFLSVASVIKRLSFLSVERKKTQESVKAIVIMKCLLTGLVRTVLKQRKDLCCGQKLGVTSFFCVSITRKNLPLVQGDFFSLF